MTTMASQITSLTTVYSTVYSDADQRKHQSPESLVLVRGIHRGPVNSPHKWPVTQEMFPFDDVIMLCSNCGLTSSQCPYHTQWASITKKIMFKNPFYLTRIIQHGFQLAEGCVYRPMIRRDWNRYQLTLILLWHFCWERSIKNYILAIIRKPGNLHQLLRGNDQKKLGLWFNCCVVMKQCYRHNRGRHNRQCSII